MAVVLRHAVGSDTDERASMYSFFHPSNGPTNRSATTGIDHHLSVESKSTSPNDDDTQPIYGFDGASERSVLDRATGWPVDRSNVSHRPPTAIDASETSLEPAHETQDVDSNQGRRKRRKITPVKPEGQEKTLKTTKRQMSSAGTISWFANLKSAGLETRAGDADNTDATRLSEATSSNDAAPQIQSSTPKRRTPRKPKLTEPDAASCQREPARSDNSALSSTKDHPTSKKTRITTPKKKISLHTNGTLLSSPRPPSPSRAKPTEPDTAVKISTSRNVKMKNGKFVQSLPIVLKYGASGTSRQSLGERLDHILSTLSDGSPVGANESSTKTHPFFLGKAAPKASKDAPNLENEVSSRDTDPGEEDSTKSKPPVAWKDIKFANAKPAGYKLANQVHPIWPPLHLQDDRVNHRNVVSAFKHAASSIGGKHKSRTCYLAPQEDVLYSFGQSLKAKQTSFPRSDTPKKRILSGRDVIKILDGNDGLTKSWTAVESMRCKILAESNAFDRGEAAGQFSWGTKHAPTCGSEVLQPSCHVLYDWLRGLAVHHVKSGIEKGTLKTREKLARKKKRQSKLRDELGDFIVDSDEEQQSGTRPRNAILLTGPTGCGKTASVYAVAKELDFEVFEIHPGMRRGAKDIFDKVGDMTQNHLVRQGDNTSRSSSIAPPDSGIGGRPSTDTAQGTLSALVGSTAPSTDKRTKVESSTTKKEQKQSLILFEEVDILFEEDRGFWTGVQSLILNSKRPVVLTCNDTKTIPMNDFDFHAVLEYVPPDADLVAEYLTYLAAVEGHVLDRQALKALYLSKGHDLRATLAELSFWCQMTVGSQFGGLDWMLQSVDGKRQLDAEGERLRVFSHNTYQTGLDLVPHVSSDEEQKLHYARQELNFSMVEWYDLTKGSDLYMDQRGETNLDALQRHDRITDVQSALDLFDDSVVPILASVLSKQFQRADSARERELTSSLFIRQLQNQNGQVCDIVSALEPIMEEKPVFPPSQGRLAPSLDTAGSSVAFDIAPYVRLIVGFDKRLEEYREEAFGSSQGSKKPRTTRAARAAAEGGNKANTRSERWFPATLDFDRVLQTAPLSWPQQWTNNGNDDACGDSPSSIMGDSDFNMSPHSPPSQTTTIVDETTTEAGQNVLT